MRFIRIALASAAALSAWIFSACSSSDGAGQQSDVEAQIVEGDGTEMVVPEGEDGPLEDTESLYENALADASNVCGPGKPACKTGQICDIRSCDTGATGLCVTKPLPGKCPYVQSFVCGCDAKNYVNECVRIREGAKRRHSGMCYAAGKDYTLAQLPGVIQKLRVAKFLNHTQPMIWSYAEDGCTDRLAATYQFLNFGDLPQYGPAMWASQNPGLLDMAKQINALPRTRVEMIRFAIAGKVTVKGTFTSDNADVKSHLKGSFGAEWSWHYAALVHTEQGPRVLDLAFSLQPLTIQDWMAKFIAPALLPKCSLNNLAATQTILAWQDEAYFEDVPVPAIPCAVQVYSMFDTWNPSSLEDSTATLKWPYNHYVDLNSTVMRLQDAITQTQPDLGDTTYFKNNPAKMSLVYLNATSLSYVLGRTGNAS